MRTTLLRRTSVAAIAAITLTGGAATATADDIVNSLVASVDSPVKVMPLTVEGAPGTTTLSVVPTNGDGKNGCNLTASTTLTVAVTSSNPSAATVSPSSVTFTSCGDTKELTVTPVAPGTTTVTLRQTANNASGSFDLTRGSFRVDVTSSPSNTAPSIMVTGVTQGAEYEFGAVPEAMCSVEDAEDGPSTGAATLGDITGPLSSYDLGSQTATCDYTDAGGLTATSSVTYSIVDTTAPSISATLAPAEDASGWWNVASGAPTVTYTCADLASGVAECPAAHTFAEGENQSHAATVYDRAGNSATAGVSDVDVDLTGPGVTWVGGPAHGARYYFGSVPAAGTCEATDALSGPDGCTVSGHGTTVGDHTVTATAKDKADNSTVETRTYTVDAWTLRGFFQPVDLGGVLNTVKGGATVPLKFEVFAGATELTDPSVVAGFTVKGTSCPGSTAAADDIEMLTTGATALRYDTTGGQFIQNWQTPKIPGACYQVTMTTDDGSSTSANFKLK